MDQPQAHEEENNVIKANIPQFLDAARQHLLGLLPVAPTAVAGNGR